MPVWNVVAGKPGGGLGGIGSGAGEFWGPSGIAVDGNGAVWVADSWNHRIQVRDPDGRWRVAGGKAGGGDGAIGSGAGEFSYPRGIAVDGNGVLWVADSGNHRIQSMGNDGRWKVFAGKAGGGEGAIGSGAGEFNVPQGIAVDGNKVLWVADSGNHRIQSMGNDGRWKVFAGKAGGGEGAIGSGAGEFSYIWGIAVDGNGVVWVADTYNHRIQSILSDGRWRVAGGKPGGGDVTSGRGTGEFSKPVGIAVGADGVVWVADYGNHRIQSMGREGRWTVSGGKPGGGLGGIGSGAGEFWSPVGIAVGADGVVWVADSGNNRIQRYGVG